MARYKAIPINEPDGEGGGWDECDPSAAKAWAVEDSNPFDFWLTDGLFDTREAAEAEAARLNEQEAAQA